MFTRIARSFLLIGAATAMAGGVAITAVADSQCTGDCDADGRVTVNEIVTGVNLELTGASADVCPSFGCNGDGSIGIVCIVQAIVNALDGCPRQLNSDVCTAAPPARTGFYGESDLFTSGAPSDPSDPVTSCGCARGGHTEWLEFRPAASGRATIDVTDSDATAVLAAFAGTCGNPTELACGVGDRGPLLSFPVTAGETYLLEAAACDNDGGALRLFVDVCGDGQVSFGEQCDDGNTVDGDGCSGSCTFDGLEVDQSWVTLGRFLGESGNETFLAPVFCGGSSVAMYYNPPTGQEFVPARSDLAAVDVLLWMVTSAPTQMTTLTLRVREDAVSGAVAGTATAAVDSDQHAPMWQHIAFSPSLSVTPGRRYVLELAARMPTLAWQVTTPDANCPVVPTYPGGQAIIFGIPRDASFFFRTYATSSRG